MSWLECSELANVRIKAVSSKAILATQEGTESEGEEKSGLKSQHKCEIVRSALSPCRLGIFVRS